MPSPRSALLFVVVGLAAALVVAGTRGSASSRPPIHVNPNMDAQPRAEAQAASRFFYDGAVTRLPVPGTVARGELREDETFWTGMGAAGFAATNPLTIDDALLERGRRRFEIYCAICHDSHGDGKGVLFERGKVRTPSFHLDRLRQAPDGYFVAVMTNGFGLMPAYGYPIPPADRWAIVAHVRVLQAQRAARDAQMEGAAQ